LRSLYKSFDWIEFGSDFLYSGVYRDYTLFDQEKRPTIRAMEFFDLCA
jgi:hypothetical protein